MKVVQVVTHFDVGGAERIAFNIVKSKTPDVKYYVVEVAYADTKYTKEMIAELESEGICYFRSDVSSTKKAILAFSSRMKRIFDDIRPDIIQTHTEIPDLSVYMFHKLHPECKFKLVRTLHNTVLWQSWTWIGKLVERYIKAEKANVSNSLAVTDAYVKNFGKDDNITLIYNGFSPQKQIPYKDIRSGMTNILFAGRFVPQKGIDVFMDVVKKCSNPNVHFHIAGQGEFEDLVKDKLGTLPNVTVKEPIANLAKFIGSFDYVIITSVHEGLNSLSIEASMNGTPCIINDIDGLNETLPKDWPLKVSKNSVPQYLDILEKIERLDYKVLCRAAKEYAEKHFSINKMQEQYELLYRK